MKTKKTSRYSTRKFLFEMAFEKSKYQDKITDRMQQIAQNWCLCMYCYLYDNNNINYSHWKGELCDLFDYLSSLVIKNKNNKTRYAYDALTKIAEYNRENVVFRSCRIKFLKENIDLSVEKQKELCYLFSKSINEIAECISGKIDFLDYVEKTFP